MQRLFNLLQFTILGITLGLVFRDRLLAGDMSLPRQSASKRPYHIIFMICDQESYHVRGGEGFSLPAREVLERRGVTFRSHYIASAVCTPSRAAMFTGKSPAWDSDCPRGEVSWELK